MADRGDTRILMGRIGAAHGIKGEVRIQSFTEEPLALVGYGPFSTNRAGLSVTIETARATTNVLVARLKGIHDRTAAEKLNGVELYVERERLPQIDDEDDFYLADLIGLEARTADGAVLGKVLAVPNHGAGDMLEIGGAGHETRLIPFTRAAVPEVHIADGFLVVDPPVELDAGEDSDMAEDGGTTPARDAG
jgi:16S rRNA processing protein RimM